MVAGILAIAANANAQLLQLDAKAALHLRDEYLIDLDVVHKKLVSLADSIPADKFTWRPSPQVRSVAEVLMHVAGEWYYVVPLSVNGAPPTGFGDPKIAMAALEKKSTKAEVLSELKRAWAHCEHVLRAADSTHVTLPIGPAKMSFFRAVVRVEGDQHEHLGQLITYARTLGVTPVWSK